MMSAQHLAPPDRTRVGRTRMRMDSGQFTACAPLGILVGPLTRHGYDRAASRRSSRFEWCVTGQRTSVFPSGARDLGPAACCQARPTPRLPLDRTQATAASRGRAEDIDAPPCTCLTQTRSESGERQ